ncbi:hypothetical protein P355_4751 [Burkholderia cenocepacia KC-01]|nr:hypothetical protein P355_4751 [Burkholderia cenocepacia KC-01]
MTRQAPAGRRPPARHTRRANHHADPAAARRSFAPLRPAPARS